MTFRLVTKRATDAEGEDLIGPCYWTGGCWTIDANEAQTYETREETEIELKDKVELYELVDDGVALIELPVEGERLVKSVQIEEVT